MKLSVMGPLLHDNPLHLQLEETLTAAELLQKVNDIALQQMQVLPGTEVIMDSEIDGNCMGFIYQQELHSNPVLAGKTLVPEAIADPLSAISDVFDIEIWEKPEGFLLYLDYDGNRYSAGTASRFGREFLQISTCMASEPQVKVGTLLKKQISC